MPFLAFWADLSLLPEDNWKISKKADSLSAVSGAGKLSIRNRGDYPGTYLNSDSLNNIQFGYGNTLAVEDALKETSVPSPEEFLTISIHGSNVEIVRDQVATLPLFIGRHEDIIAVSNDYKWVVDSIGTENLTLNEGALARYLLAVGSNTDTLFNEIRVVDDCRHIVESSDAACMFEKLDVKLQRELSDPKKFGHELEKVFRQIESNIDISQAGFEFSGGIDSATAPAWYSQKTNVDLYAMLFPFSERNSQMKKIHEFNKSFDANSHIVEISPDDDYPLSRYHGRDRAMFFEYQEIYSEVLGRMAAQLQADNKRFIFTGIGGNELFEPFESIHRHKDELEAQIYKDRFSLSNLHTDKVKEIAAKHLRNHPWKRSLMAHSIFSSNCSRNNIYIEKDIWPISPLANPQLFLFVSQLEEKYRTDKLILRAYQESRDYPKSIYAPKINENFGEFFEKSIEEYILRVAKRLLSKSKLIDEGLVDAEYADLIVKDSSSLKPNDYIQLFTFVCAELILASLHSTDN